MAESRIIETDPRADKSRGGTGIYDGIVDSISAIGLKWKAVWHEATGNKSTRDLEISIDDNSQIMTIRESGGGGGEPLQIWKGPYRKIGDEYRMSGVIVEDGGNHPAVLFTIDANLYLP